MMQSLQRSPSTKLDVAHSLPSCLNVTAHVDHRFGGLTTSLPPFCKALESTGRYGSPIAAFCLPDEKPAPSDSVLGPAILPTGRVRWLVDRRLRERLFNTIKESSAVHIHGLWQEHSFVASEMAREMGKPYLVSAHGMLEPWALRQKSWKKNVYWGLFEKRRIQRAHCLRALTLAEAEQYRALGLRQPVAVIPNGVEVPNAISPEPFYSLYPHLRGCRILLFLGRLHHKKGVHLLCRAWEKMCREYPDAQLVFAGPDSEEDGVALKSHAAESGLKSRITFTGMLRGEDKWAALRAATAFVLPSFSEGFSVAVLEAMGVGTPVIISEQCYFPEVKASKCGWIIDPNPEDLQRALQECLESSTIDLETIGARGRSLVESRFCWPVVARQTADLLDWVLGGPCAASLEMVD